MPFVKAVELDKATGIKIATAYDEKAENIQATISFHARVTPKKVSELVEMQALDGLKIIIGTEQFSLAAEDSGKEK